METMADDGNGGRAPSLPLFDLAPLRSIDPERIVSRDKATPFEKFMLALALFYNDWKGLAWFREAVLLPQKPRENVVSTYNGQWTGLSIQIARLQLGMLHELMSLLHGERKLLGEREVTNLIATLPKGSRDAWKTIVAIALEQPGGNSALRKALLRIRNALAFHYDQPKCLERAFQRFFFESAKAGSDRAYYSRGETMEGTRFYYADAAANLAITGEASVAGTDDISKDATDVGNNLNLALGMMLQNYLADRAKGRK